jgi:HSP90 family molecular chaperone
MVNSKMTQKDYFNEIIALAKDNGRNDLVIFAEGRIAQLEKKAGSKKPTKTQAENEDIKDTIRAALGSADKAVTVTELQGLDEALGALSNQRVSALLRQMVKANEVVKIVEKKKSYFSLAVGG